MKRTVYDCDNTMGVPFRDVDDALTILYLLGSENVDCRGITTTFGNDTVDTVWNTTRTLLSDIGKRDIPHFKGGTPENRESDAAQFLAETASTQKGEITLLATGALTNLYGAYLLDRNFFSNLKEIVLMGGVTGPLIIDGKEMKELNFSCDPEASYHVLNCGGDVSVITGHLCLQYLFGETEFLYLNDNSDTGIFSYVLERITPWRDFMEKIFSIKGFYNWDVTAALFITEQDHFKSEVFPLGSTEDDLKSGFLRRDESAPVKITMPIEITGTDELSRKVFSAWETLAPL